MRCLMFLMFAQIAFLANAECYYSNYILKIEFSINGEEKQTCFKEISTCDFDIDSIGINDYLKKSLLTEESTGKGSVYKYQFIYKYCPDDSVHCTDRDKLKVYELLDAFNLPVEDIVDFSVTDYVQISALEGISTKLSSKDTIWLNHEPIESISIGAYLCYHTIVVYQKSPELDLIMGDVYKLRTKIQQLGDEINGNNGDHYDEKVRQLIDSINNVGGAICVSGCSD